ncbi:MAG: hypothetical protein Kow0013_05520 [Pararhodobacter sp.]
MSRPPVILGALAACLAVSGCFDIPDLRGRPPYSGPSRPASTVPAPVGDPLGPPVPAASEAERACLAAGQEAGFDVRGVVGTHEVTDASGLAVSRDVMLRVQRGGQELQVRCSYAYAAGAARIMTL